MKIFKSGESVQAICHNCESIQNAVFQVRDVPFSEGGGTTKNILVGVCEQCDHVIVTPHQSTPSIKKQLETQRKPIESRLPAHMLDILNLASVEIGGTVDLVPHLMRFYIHNLATDAKAASKITIFLRSELAKGKAEKRLSLKGRMISEDIDALKKAADINNTTDLIKGVILKINDDVLVKKRASAIKELRGVLAAAV